MSAKKKGNKKHDEWMEQMEDAYVGKTLICPYCGHRSAHITFCFSPDNIGYCYAECDDCKAFESVISRMGRTDKIKANIKEVSFLSFDNTSK